MKIELNAHEQILIAALVNSRATELKQEHPVDDRLVEVYTNLRNKIIK